MFHDKIKVILEFCDSRFPRYIEKTSIRDLLARSWGLACQQKGISKFQIEVSKGANSMESVTKIPFPPMHHSLPFISIQSKKPLIPCHLHHSTQPTPRHPMIQTMIHHRMIPLVMKMMMRCWWNKINKNHQQQNCRPTIQRIISTLPWGGGGGGGRTYKFFCHGHWLHYP